MKQISVVLTKLLDEMRRIDRDINVGNANNQLLVQCRRNHQLVRTMKVGLDDAFGLPETAAFWQKYRQISNRYCRVVQGVSLVMLFSKMHFDLVSPADTIPLLRVHLDECHKYSEARALRLESRLNELLKLLTNIGEARNVGEIDLRILFLTFDEKLRLAMLDADECTHKVKETYRAISGHFNEIDGGNAKYLTVAMGALLGSTFGGLFSWLFVLSIVPCMFAATVIGTFLIRYYNSPSSDDRAAKLLFTQHQDKYSTATQNLDNLINEVEHKSLNL